MPTIDRDGVKIHYEVHGAASDRTPLLLSHGFGATAEMWAPNVDALSATRLAVTWDIRGHGLSDSPDDPACYTQEATLADMAAILDVCGIDRVAVGGHSLGGFLSLAFHLAHRDRTAALLLFNTGPGFKQDEGRAEWNEMAEGLAVSFEGNPGLARAAGGILPQHDARVIDSLPDIAVPTLVLVGEYDRRFLAAAEYQAAKIPGAHKAVIADAGHAANIDQPDAFNQAVLEFLDQHVS